MILKQKLWEPTDDKGFRCIYGFGNSRYTRDNLFWYYWTDQAGDLCWRVIRNDRLDPTEEDMKIVDEATKFIMQESYGPQQ